MAQPYLALRSTGNGQTSHKKVAGSKNPLPLGMGSVKELGYTDKEATVLSLINFSGDRRLRGLCEAFAVQKEKRFIADNYFADDYDHVSEEESFDMPITLHQMNRTAFLSRLRPNACDLISKEECCDIPMAMPQKNRASSLSMPSPDDCGARRSDVHSELLGN